MADQKQLRRGTTAQHSAFIGAAGEVTVDTDKNAAVVHDGSTAGGFPVAKQSYVESVTVNFATDGNLILTASQANRSLLTLTDTSALLTAGRTVDCSAGTVAVQVVKNDTLQTLTLSRGGTTQTIAAGTRTTVMWNGTTGALVLPLSYDGTKLIASAPADLSAGGAYFGGNAASNMLDAVEKGTWTPLWSLSVSGTATATLNDNATYTLFADRCAISGRIGTSSISSPSGSVTITGIPFAAASGSNNRHGLAIGELRRWATDMPNFKAEIQGDGTSILLWKQASNSSAIAAVLGSDMDATASYNLVSFAGIYQTA